MEYLLDWEEKFKKPVFSGREGQQVYWPNGPFLISEGDVRECVKVLIGSYYS